MCGICGVLNFNSQPVDKLWLTDMCGEMIHRGPDTEGYYLADRVGLGHRRLSIIDLETGSQPIHNESKTIWLIINGEIYNFIQLRKMLEENGHTFYTQTDSEVIVHLYEDYKEDCLRFLRGMFALAIWDSRQRKLFLARDRIGQKPLLFWQDEQRFIFASEIKAILQAPGIKREVDPKILNLYLSFQCVPAPGTMFKGIRKLLPAHYLIVKEKQVNIQRYWRLDFRVGQRLGLQEYKRGIQEHLSEAVRLRLMSDVPLGAFLSGGIDSSAIVAFMSRHLKNPVKTFSVGFSEKSYDEVKFARMVAKKFNTDHHELKVSPKAIEILPKIIKHYGEPFADYSCIPTYYVSQFAATKVKVVLTGDGGDESFAGYYRYTACKIAQIFDCLPPFLRKLIQNLLYLIPDRGDMRTTNWQLKRFFRSLHHPAQKRYLNWICSFNKQEKSLLYSSGFLTEVDLNYDFEFLTGLYRQKPGLNFVDDTIQVEMETYLPNDLLVKIDIATMANSLEARSPFLDHKFMEYAATNPLDLKLKRFRNKYIFKQALKGFLPAEIIKRKKLGFGIPIGRWFRGELKEYMQDILLDAKSINRGYFRKKYIERIIDAHLRGLTDNGYKLWTLLMLELWHREFID